MKSTISKFPYNMYFLPVPEKEVRRFSSKRVVCTINKQRSFHCAFINSKEFGYYVYISKAVMKQLGLKLGTEVDVHFQNDTSEYQSSMPEELEEVLQSDPAAKEVFESLTAGGKRSIIYLVLQVKSIDKRIERSLRIAGKLKNGVTAAKLMLT